MKTIDDILNEQGFEPKEKETFISMLSHAKMLQKNMGLDQLKSYMNEEIDKLLN